MTRDEWQLQRLEIMRENLRTELDQVERKIRVRRDRIAQATTIQRATPAPEPEYVLPDRLNYWVQGNGAT